MLVYSFCNLICRNELTELFVKLNIDDSDNILIVKSEILNIFENSLTS